MPVADRFGRHDDAYTSRSGSGSQRPFSGGDEAHSALGTTRPTFHICHFRGGARLLQRENRAHQPPPFISAISEVERLVLKTLHRSIAHRALGTTRPTSTANPLRWRTAPLPPDSAGCSARSCPAPFHGGCDDQNSWIAMRRRADAPCLASSCGQRQKMLVSRGNTNKACK